MQKIASLPNRQNKFTKSIYDSFLVIRDRKAAPHNLDDEKRLKKADLAKRDDLFFIFAGLFFKVDDFAHGESFPPLFFAEK